MQICHLEFESNFHIVMGNSRAQAAIMTLAKGDATGGPDNRHPDSDQWLYVVSGQGEGIIDGQRQPLRAGTLLLIERNESHEIKNTGDQPLQTVNLYVPPAYAPEEGQPADRD